jgi:signal transduction histidine kinase
MIARVRKALRMQLLPLVLGFAALAATIAGHSWLIETQRQDNVAVRAAFVLERRIGAALTLIQDAEASQRGYLLTREAQYLEPYKAAISALPAALAAIGESVESNPSRLQLDRLQAAVEEKLAELAETVRLQQAGDANAALALIRTGRGELAMEGIRAIVADLQRDEGAALQGRLAASERANDWLRIISIATLAGVFLLALYGIANARRQLRTVAAAQASLEATNATLRQEIATRQQAEAQIRQLQKMEAIGQLTGGIAHDFNNMLAVIISAMNLAQRKLSRGETDIGKFVEAAADAATRAGNLTARLLAFSRQQPLAPQVIDVNRLVTRMSKLLRRTLGESIEVETVLSAELWKTRADPSQLENAILNLAVNGRDAMPEGGRLTIETANAHLDDGYAATHAEVTPGQYVMIAVTDAGVGMSPEIMAKAFEPFFTTKAVNKGTGLGLSQVFGFVKQSDGHVKIYSEPGAGTTVRVYLKRHFGDEQPAAPASSSVVLEREPTETVLVVEDDARVRAVSVDALTDLGYHVIQAADAAEALKQLDEHPEVALLFTDIIMPGMNGRKLAEEALKRRPGLKVLFTTGFTRNAVVHNGVLDPGVNFLAKPFTIDKLAAKVREVLGRT